MIVSHEFCRRLTVRCCNFTILLIQVFLSLLLAIKHSMLFALFIMIFGMVRDIFFIPSFQKVFFCPILGRTGANGSVDVATKIINTGILHV